MMTVIDFDMATLADSVIDLFLTAAGGQGWLATELEHERERRERGKSDETARPLVLPFLDNAGLRAEYLEIGKSLIALESYQAKLINVDPVRAAELSCGAELFYKLMVALKRGMLQTAAAQSVN